MMDMENFREPDKRNKYAIYSDRETPLSEIHALEEEMKNNPSLSEYIGKEWSRQLVGDYLNWLLALKDFESAKEQKMVISDERREKLQEAGLSSLLPENKEKVLNQSVLTGREIKKLLEFIEKYPQETEEAFLGNETNVSKAYEELAFLKNIKRYIDKKMSSNEESDFTDSIFEDNNKRIIFEKIMKAFEA